MNSPGVGDWLSWQFSVPNLILFGALVWVLWYKLHLLRLTLLETVDNLVEKLRMTAPPYAVGETFVKEEFGQIREAVRELSVRTEHVEALLQGAANDQPDRLEESSG